MLQFPAYLDENPIEPPQTSTEAETAPALQLQDPSATISPEAARSDSPGTYSNTHAFTSDMTSPLKDPVIMGIRSPITPSSTDTGVPQLNSPIHVATAPIAAIPIRPHGPLGPLPPIQGRAGALPPLVSTARSPTGTNTTANGLGRTPFPIQGVSSPIGDNNNSPKQPSLVSAGSVSAPVTSSNSNFAIGGVSLPRRLEAQASLMNDPGAAELTLADITNGPINFDDSGNGNPYNRDARTEIPASGPDRGHLDDDDDHGHFSNTDGNRTNNLHSYGNTLGRANFHSPTEHNPSSLTPSTIEGPDRHGLLRLHPQPSTSPVLSRAQPSVAGASVTLIGSSHSDAGDDEDPFDQLEHEWQGVTAAAVFAFSDPPSITIESMRIVLLSTGQLLALGTALLANTTSLNKSQKPLSGIVAGGGGSAGTNSAATNDQIQSNRNPFKAPSVDRASIPNTSISDHERLPAGLPRTASGVGGRSMSIGLGTAAVSSTSLGEHGMAATTLQGKAMSGQLVLPLALIIQCLRLIGMNLSRFKALPESPLAKRLAEFTMKDFEDLPPSFLVSVGSTTGGSTNNATPLNLGMKIQSPQSTPTTGKRQKKKVSELLENMIESVTNARDREYDEGIVSSFYHRSWITSRPSPSEVPFSGDEEIFENHLITAVHASATIGPVLSFPRQCTVAFFQLVCIMVMTVISGVYHAIPELIILLVALLLHIIAIAALISSYRLSLIYYCASGTSLVVAGAATIANVFSDDRGSDDGDYDTKLPLAGVMCAMLVVVYLLGSRCVELFSELDAVRLSPAMAFESVWTARLVTLPTLITVVAFWYLASLASCVICWIGHGDTKTDLSEMPMADIIVLFGTVAGIIIFIINAIYNCFNANRHVRAFFAAGTLRIHFLESLWMDQCQPKQSSENSTGGQQALVNSEENPLMTNISHQPQGPTLSEEPDTTSAGPSEGRREGVFGSVSPAAFAQQYNVTASGHQKNGIQLAGRDLSIDGELLIYAYDTDQKPSDSYSSGGPNVIGVPTSPSGNRAAPVILRSMLQDVHYYTAITCVNASGNVTFWNKRMELLTGFKQMDVVGQSIYSFMLGSEYQQNKVKDAISNTLKDVNEETRFKAVFSNTKRMQQASIALELSAFPAKTTQGVTVGVLFVGNSDSTEILKEVADELYAIQTQRLKQANTGISATPLAITDSKSSITGAVGESASVFPTSPVGAEPQLLSPLLQSGSNAEDASLTKLSHIFARLNDAIDVMSLTGASGDEEAPVLVSIPVLVGRIVSTRLGNRKVNVKIAPNMLPANLNDERLSFVLMETLQHYTERNNSVTLNIGYDVKRAGAIAFNFQPQKPFGQWVPSPHSTACLEKLRAMVRAGHKGAITLIFLGTVSASGPPPSAVDPEEPSKETLPAVPSSDNIRCNIALMDSNPVTNTLIRTQSWNRKHLLYFIDDMESLESSLDSVDVLFVRFPRDQFPEDIDHLLRRLIVSKTYLYIVLIEPLQGNPNLRVLYGDRITALNQPVTLQVLQNVFHVAVDFVVKKRQKERKALEAKELFTTAKSAPWQRGALLGQGSFATVYEATNMVTKGRMAVRIIKIDRTGDSEAVNKLVRDTIAEIKLMASLEHKNIISYLYCEKDVDTINVFMEYAERGSLMSVLKRGPVPVETAAGWVRDILSGLDYLHSQGVIHLDLKAANVLLTEDGTCKLADFGTSRQILNVAGRRNSTVADYAEPAGGTLHFMAPEVLAGESPTWRADIWSLGCVVVELLTGKPPHSHIENPLAVARYVSLLTPDSIPIIPSTITNSDAIKFIEACLRVDAEQRPSAQTLMVHPFILENAVKENALKQPKPLAVGRRPTTKQNQTTISTSEDSIRRESCFSMWGGGKPM